MEDRDDSTVTPRLMLAACAAGFFWLFALHVLTGFLDFMAKDGVGSRSGMVGNIDAAINSALVAPLGRPLTAVVLFVVGIGVAWLVARSPRQDVGKDARREEATSPVSPVRPPAPSNVGFGKRPVAPALPASASNASHEKCADLWAGWPETLDVSAIADVNWIKQSSDPLVWHAAAMACLFYRGDEHGLIAWLVQQPSLDRVTAAVLFLHAGNGVHYLKNDNIRIVRMNKVQVEEMINLLCDLDKAQVLTDNGIGMEPDWELTRLETVAALADNPRTPLRFLGRPIDQQTAAMPYADIGEGDLVSKKWMRENMPYLFD